MTRGIVLAAASQAFKCPVRIRKVMDYTGEEPKVINMYVVEVKLNRLGQECGVRRILADGPSWEKLLTMIQAEPTMQKPQKVKKGMVAA